MEAGKELDIGLSDKEARVYRALLELGPATVTEITKKAGVTRTFGYQILEDLSIQGLVSQVSSKGKKLKFTAQHPQRLIQYLKNRRNQWDRRLKEVEDKLPDLVSLYKVADKPVVKYQEGYEGHKAIYEQTLESKEEILSILDLEYWDVPELRQWAKDYNRRRSEEKIRERILILDTKKGRGWMKDYRGSFKYTNYRWIKPEQIPGVEDFGGELNVYENKVVMALLKKPNVMGVMIESQALANILKGLFELAWQSAEPLKK